MMFRKECNVIGLHINKLTKCIEVRLLSLSKYLFLTWVVRIVEVSTSFLYLCTLNFFVYENEVD